MVKPKEIPIKASLRKQSVRKAGVSASKNPPAKNDRPRLGYKKLRPVPMAAMLQDIAEGSE